MNEWRQHSYLASGNSDYIETLYESFLAQPDSVSPQWRDYFSQLQGETKTTDISHAELRQQFALAGKMHSVASPAISSQDAVKEVAVTRLIYFYRRFGHLQADLDPLKLSPKQVIPELQLSYHDLNETTDLNRYFHALTTIGNGAIKTLKDAVELLQQTYCHHIGVEYMHINNPGEVRWLREYFEQDRNQTHFTPDKKKSILHKLLACNEMEKSLGTRYVAQTRFSLEGGDSLIPALDTLIQHGGEQGVKDCVIGMAHRGRLNVLVNIIGKSSRELFDEFEGKLSSTDDPSGDVKYHLGFSSDVETASGITHLTMAFNPSHLEIITPVIEGIVHARQRRRHDEAHRQILPITIHGDSALSGQGIVMETFNFSKTESYDTGGTIHLIINNQVGFTTSEQYHLRSTHYCTDIAKMVEAPIFHVNGDDPEAVCLVAEMALKYRMTYKKDVIIDLVCYRRHGHNEADDPTATQPLMYQAIRKHTPLANAYAQQLIADNIVTAEQVEQFTTQYRSDLDSGKSLVATVAPCPEEQQYLVDWTPHIKNPSLDITVKTSLSTTQLKALARQLDQLPDDLVLQAQVARMLQERKKMTAGEVSINWGYAEALAYASLLTDQYGIRLSGEDSQRGTFAHRHAVLHDQKTGRLYTPLNNLSDKQKEFVCINSPLSELSVLAFEYGYASSQPNELVIWEAQYGDFANATQVVADEFLSSAEQKWRRYCGLVMFLPHGYEGAGPDHSSARVERYLQLCAEQNMSVCVPTTPAQIFHLLRLQMLRNARKPLIILTPKSLLRHKLAVSSFEELAGGHFQTVIPELDKIANSKVKKVVLCMGKVYYDLLERRRANKLTDIAIVRLEQIYPFPAEALAKILAQYPKLKEVVWCQEEPKNQGCWYQIYFHLIAATVEQGRKLTYAGRAAAAAPATGSKKQHAVEQENLVAEALVSL